MEAETETELEVVPQEIRDPLSATTTTNNQTTPHLSLLRKKKNFHWYLSWLCCYPAGVKHILESMPDPVTTCFLIFVVIPFFTGALLFSLLSILNQSLELKVSLSICIPFTLFFCFCTIFRIIYIQSSCKRLKMEEALRQRRSNEIVIV